MRGSIPRHCLAYYRTVKYIRVACDHPPSTHDGNSRRWTAFAQTKEKRQCHPCSNHAVVSLSLSPESNTTGVHSTIATSVRSSLGSLPCPSQPERESHCVSLTALAARSGGPARKASSPASFRHPRYLRGVSQRHIPLQACIISRQGGHHSGQGHMDFCRTQLFHRPVAGLAAALLGRKGSAPSPGS